MLDITSLDQSHLFKYGRNVQALIRFTWNQIHIVIIYYVDYFCFHHAEKQL